MHVNTVAKKQLSVLVLYRLLSRALAKCTKRAICRLPSLYSERNRDERKHSRYSQIIKMNI